LAARLIESLATTELLAEVFSDISILQAMLDFEIALARAEAHLGIVPKAAADCIAAAGHATELDIHALSRAMFRAGTPGKRRAELCWLIRRRGIRPPPR
jgi:3-carboxy-cis,cis-muconate cycloisomerase